MAVQTVEARSMRGGPQTIPAVTAGSGGADAAAQAVAPATYRTPLAAAVKATVDIVDVISETVRLHRSGRKLVGDHGVHPSRSRRSLQVDPDRQAWWCWNCGQHGDVIDWLQQRDGVTWWEAVRRLAARAGIDPATWRPTRGGLEAMREAALERTLQARLEAKCEQATMALLPVRRAVWRGLPDLEDPWGRAAALARLDRLDDLFDRLAAGEPEERLAALEEAAAWASW